MDKPTEGGEPAEPVIEDVKPAPTTVPKMKEEINYFKTKMRMLQEPTQDLKDILVFIRSVLDNPDAVFGEEKEVRKFFLNEYVPGVASSIAKSIKLVVKSDDFKRVAVQETPKILAEVVAAFADDADLISGMIPMFDPTSRLYQYHGKSEENSILLNNSKEQIPEEEHAWREGLSVGEKLDAIKVDPERKVKCWGGAVVTEVLEGQKVKVRFDLDTYHNDRTIYVFSPQIAPHEKYSKDQLEFRQALKVGDLIDCFDSTDMWYASEVIEQEEREFQKTKIPMVKVAFRVAHPQGDKSLPDGTKFYGWEPCYDEWIPLCSARIAKYKTHTTDDLAAQSSTSQNAKDAYEKAKEEIDDSLDMTVTHIKGVEIVAVQRRQCTSDVLVNFLNDIGRHGGFEKILKRIEEPSEDPMELLLLSEYAEMFTKCNCMLHKQFVDKYFVQIEEAIMKKLLNPTSQQLRNITLEGIIAIFKAIYLEMLKRVSSFPESVRRGRSMVNNFKVGSICIVQNFLPRRIDGLKMINTACNQCLSLLKWAPSPHAKEKVEDPRVTQKAYIDEVTEGVTKDDFVLNQIFLKENTHHELVSRTEKLLAFLLHTRNLTHKHLEMIWNLSEENDGEMSEEVYKSLQGAASEMRAEDRLFLISRIETIPEAQLNARHIQLVSHICIHKNQKEQQEVSDKGLRILYGMAIESGPQFGFSMVNLASLAFSSLLLNQNIMVKLEYFDKLANCLKENKMGIQVLQKVQVTLKCWQHAGPTNHPEVETEADFIDYLETKHDFLNTMFANLEDYMTRMKDAYMSNAKFFSTPEVQVIADKYTHGDQITQRLEFMSIYFNFGKVKLTAKHLAILWNQLVTKSPVINDHKLAFNWVRKICDKMTKDPSKSCTTIEDLTEFYKTSLNVKSEGLDEFKFLNEEGFHCIQSFFVLFNSRKGYIQKLYEGWGIYKVKKPEQKEEEAKTGDAAAEGEASHESSQPSQSQEESASGGDKSGKPKYTAFSSETGPSFKEYSFTNKGKTEEGKEEAQSTASEKKAKAALEGLNQLVTEGTQTGSGDGKIHPVQDPGPSGEIGPQPKPQADENPKDSDPNDLEILVKVPPTQLEGYDLLWRIATESTSKQAIDAAVKLLTQIHYDLETELQPRLTEFEQQFIGKCFQIIEDQLPTILTRTPEEKSEVEEKVLSLGTHASTIQKLRVLPVEDRRIIRSLFILRQLIRASEKTGTHSVRPHSSLSQGKLLGKLDITNNIKTGGNFRHCIPLQMDSNATIWDLKELIGREVVRPEGMAPGDPSPMLPYHPANIRMIQANMKQINIRDISNGNTLAEMNFKENELVAVFPKVQALAKKAPIMRDNSETGEPELTLRAHQIIEEVFSRFACNHDGLMSMNEDAMIAFVASSTNTKVETDDKRVQTLRDDFCKTRPNHLTVDELKNFYFAKMLEGTEDTIRRNFKDLGYANDLSRIPKEGDPVNIMQPRKSMEEMPRHMIAANQSQFDTLFKLFDAQNDVKEKALEFIRLLVTSPVLMRRILELKSEEGQEFCWNDLFQSDSVHKMLYSLEIVEAILVKDSNKSTKDWVKDFLRLGGLSELQRQLKLVLERVGKSPEHSKEIKAVVIQLLKLIQLFVTAVTDKEELAKFKEAAQAELKKKKEEQDKAAEVDEATLAEKNKEKTVTTPGGEEITEGLLFDFTEPSNEGAKNKVQDSEKAKLPASTEEAAAKIDIDQTHLDRVVKEEDLIQEIKDQIDSDELQKSVEATISLTLESSKQIPVSEQQVIESALKLWSAIISSKQGQLTLDNIHELESIKLNAEFVTKGLLFKHNKNIRVFFKQTFQTTLPICPSITESLFEILNDTLTDIEAQGEDTKEFFEILTNITQLGVISVGQMPPEMAEENMEDSLKILEKAIGLLQKHKTLEEKMSNKEDETLVGINNLIFTVLHYSLKIEVLKPVIYKKVCESDLLEILYDTCLFSEHGCVSKYECHCFTTNSRHAAYLSLCNLLEYLEPHEINKFLEEKLLPLLSQVERPKRWAHSPASNRRPGRYIGINNLGCICYMISMLQQFYMVPQFRYQLLKAVDDTPPDMTEYKGDMIDDNMLRQLQKMFGFLEKTDRFSSDPKDFCFAFKEFDGRPTIIGEQKDSQEFLNFFFERLENQLKPTNQRYLLRDVFQGTQLSQLICSSCGHVGNTIEPFYNLSLQVKGFSDIHESLARHIKGQQIEDYRCSSCDKKVTVMKRNLLGEMPNVLVVHLQRIIFSFDTLMNDKVNTKLEFPNILDLKDYSYKETFKDAEEHAKEVAHMKEISDDDYIYRLVGVNIHVGTADHGHYYSLINTERGQDEKDPYTDEDWGKVEKQPWKKFDDNTVSDFYFNGDLKKEAFGGNYESQSDTSAQLFKALASGTGQTYGKSAYMLVYERKSKKKITELDGKEEKALEFRGVENYMPEWLKETIEKDNKHFLIDSQLFNQDFFTMTRRILRYTGSDLVLRSHRFPYEYQPEFYKLKKQTLKAAGKVVFDMLAYYDMNVQLSETVNSFESILTFCDSTYSVKRGDPCLTVEFLKEFFFSSTEQTDHIFSILFKCTDSISRRQTANLLSKVVSKLFKLYAEFTFEEREEFEAVKEIWDIANKFMDTLFLAFHDEKCQKNWSRLEFFFKMVLDISQSSLTAAQVVMERGDVISDMIDFMLGSASPRALASGEKRISMGGTIPAPFQSLHTFVAFLIRMTHTSEMDLGERMPTHFDLLPKTPQEQIKTYFLSEEAWLMISKTKYLGDVLYDPKYEDMELFGKAMAHLCYKNLSFSRKVCKHLIKSISLSTNDRVEYYLAMIIALALIKDEYQVHRLEYLFGFAFPMHTKAEEGIPQYGLPISEKKNFENPYNIFTTLDSKNHDDSLLNLLWKYKTRMSNFTLTCLGGLVKLIAQDEAIADYFLEMPSPHYTQIRYTDWIRPYLEKELKEARDACLKDKEENVVTVISLFEKYEAYVEANA